MPCSEELEIFGQNLYILFESAGQKYYEGTDGKRQQFVAIRKDHMYQITISVKE